MLSCECFSPWVIVKACKSKSPNCVSHTGWLGLGRDFCPRHWMSMSLTSFCRSTSELPNPSMYESIPQLRNQVKVQLQRLCCIQLSTEYYSYGKTYRKHLHSVQSEVGIDSTGCFTGILKSTSILLCEGTNLCCALAKCLKVCNILQYLQTSWAPRSTRF